MHNVYPITSYSWFFSFLPSPTLSHFSRSAVAASPWAKSARSQGYFGLRHRLWPTADGEVGQGKVRNLCLGNALYIFGLSLKNKKKISNRILYIVLIYKKTTIYG
jgi:hypothetical protein